MQLVGWGGAGCTPTCASPQLPLSLYKKVLVIMHDSILPHLAQPSLMLDFLTRAYDIGEQGTLPRGGPGRPATCVLGAPKLGV